MSRSREGLPESLRFAIPSARLLGFGVIGLLTIIALLIGAFLLRNEMRREAFTDCLKEPQRGSLITLRFDWLALPPGYICVYRNDEGEIIGEEWP